MTATTHAEQANQQPGSGHHRGGPPAATSSAVAPSPGIHYGVSHDPGGNLNVRQPGTFRTALTRRRRYGTSRSAVRTAGGNDIDFTRCSCSRLVQCSAPTCLDRCLVYWLFAQHVFPYTRPTPRHSYTCFRVESTGSSAACHKVSRRYAGDGSLHLKHRSPQPGHGGLRFKRRSAGNGSLRLEPLPDQGTGACTLSVTPPARGVHALSAALFS